MIAVLEVKLGTPRRPTQWSNSLQKNVEIDYKDYFVQRIKRSVFKDVEISETVQYCEDTLDIAAQHYHPNYLGYLEQCWSDHLGIVITPDIIWFTLLSEFAILVKKDVEAYRSLFTNSSEKKEIIVASGSLTVMPLDTLTEVLKANVPSDSNIFLPNFESFTNNSRYAMLSTFCDLCSPYYNYSMYLCGFPFIDVKGSIEDWKGLKEQWLRLKSLVQQNEIWVSKVDAVLNSILARFKDDAWWKNILSIKNCGSGHQTMLTGWITDLFVEQPKVRYAENFSPHISNVKYKQLDTGKAYQMSTGLFSSISAGECLEPSFSSIIYEIPEALL